MRIGIDFDNTIVSYDALFHQLAIEMSIIPSDLPVSKLAIRDYLRNANKENLWTLMQGEIYGPRMREANAYPGFFNFAKKAQEYGHKIFIISHKTRHPFSGPKYDLHQSAKEWVKHNMIPNGIQFNENIDIFFEATKEKKIARIHDLSCDVFVDDLLEILEMPGFPIKTQKILFDSDQKFSQDDLRYIHKSSWQQIESYIFK